MDKWLEFHVTNEKCQHEQDSYDGCPLCEIGLLQAEIDIATEIIKRYQDLGISDWASEYNSDIDDFALLWIAKHRRKHKGE